MDLLAVYMIKLSNYTVATYIWPALYMYSVQRERKEVRGGEGGGASETEPQTAFLTYDCLYGL